MTGNSTFRLGIMQPYFFPYIGYFSIIKHVDEFMLFDPVQFIYHGWIERNRILKPNDGWQYIKVPLEKHTRETLIQDIRIRNDEPWREKIIAQLQHYRRAKNYKVITELIQSALDCQSDSITKIDEQCLKAVCHYLGIATPITVFSELSLELPQIREADEWALEICKAKGADEYWNPPGGKEFFDADKYKRAGIEIRFVQAEIQPYPQWNREFVDGLSIIDVLMFNSVQEIQAMLDSFIFI